MGLVPRVGTEKQGGREGAAVWPGASPPAPTTCPSLPGPGPHRSQGFYASSRGSDPRLRQAPPRVPPSKPTSLRPALPARSLPGPGGRARLPGRGESEGGRRGRRGAGRAGRDAEGRAGLRLLQPPLGSRAAAGGTRDLAGQQRAQLPPPASPATHPGAPTLRGAAPPPAPASRLPRAPETRRAGAPGQRRAGSPHPSRGASGAGQTPGLGGRRPAEPRPAKGKPQGRWPLWRVGVVPGDRGIKVCKIEGPSSQGLCRCSRCLLGKREVGGGVEGGASTSP